jgi:enterobactin synthetase component D
MFTLTTTFSDTSFIRCYEVGFVTHQPSIRVCKIQFDINQYSDSLFSQFLIPFPDILISAVAKRRAEYLASRLAAQTLLKDEKEYEVVTIGPDRAPQWPTQWAGSISHNDQYAIVVIAPSNKGFNLGVDIESLKSQIMHETADVFTSPHEQELLAKSGIDYELALLIAFSAKESFFKAIYPHVKKLFGFEAMVLSSLDVKTQSFTLKLTQHLDINFPAGQYYSGLYLLKNDNIVITLIT